MTGGSGHIMDMNNRIKQNRALKKARKKKFSPGFSRFHKYTQTFRKKPEAKKMSEAEFQIVKKRIEIRARKEQRKNLLINFVLLLIAVLTVTYVYLLLIS